MKRFTFFTLVLILMGSCVQKTKQQTVHFSVDARAEENVKKISVRGSVPPLNWNTNFELTDTDQDSIYTGTIIFDIPYDYVNLKFVKNDNEFELQDKPNRSVKFDQSLTTNYSATFNLSPQSADK